MSVVNLAEDQVKDLLSWPLVYEAVEQALRSITEIRTSESQPTANQPTRIFTPAGNGKGVLLTMPGFIGNYHLKHTGRGDAENNKVFNTLACKLVTSFVGNKNLSPPKPSIIGNICIFSEDTGELRAIVQATEITAWRTAGASLVATAHLFLQRPTINHDSPKNMAIIGCGVQGRIHAIGLCSTYNVATIYLWNRTKQRAEDLVAELNQLRNTFINPQLQIVCADTVASAVSVADVIVTATYSRTPLVCRSMLKDNVHINAVGAGEVHHSELSEDIYKDAATKIYVDNIGSARTELASLDAPIVGEVGDVINRAKQTPSTGITIFHSMGMAVEDAAVAEAVLQKYLNNK